MVAARRRSLLVASLGFALLQVPDGEEPPVLRTVKRWLGTWSGIGVIAAGMARQGYDLSLARFDDFGWRATFYVSGMEHSATAATGSAFETTPFRAVHVAAWTALGRHSAEESDSPE